jgi:hypothetical protein
MYRMCGMRRLAARSSRSSRRSLDRLQRRERILEADDLRWGIAVVRGRLVERKLRNRDLGASSGHNDECVKID